MVRHAEPLVSGLLLGQSDPPLCENGRQQARAALPGLRVERVYSSPLQRARETAAVIDAPLEVVDELAEISMGEWDGLAWKEIEHRWPELARAKTQDWLGVTPPGGESWQEFQSRVCSALRNILHSPLTAAVVGHFAVNSVIERELRGADPAGYQQEYCEIKEYDLTEPETRD
ncbi:MAG: histidine phosphatase family protein [bacterium]|nr:histidine phosphatase family protein [bacterium]